MMILYWCKKTGKWILAHREQFFLLFGVVLVGIVSFEAGMIRGAIVQSKPLTLSLPAVPTEEADQKSVKTEEKAVSIGLQRIVAQESDTNTKSCMFVGSRNSNKYHLPTCSFAKRIKLENRVCFASKEDAEKKGYVAGCLK